jgi:hypothetical protein
MITSNFIESCNTYPDQRLYQRWFCHPIFLSISINVASFQLLHPFSVADTSPQGIKQARQGRLDFHEYTSLRGFQFQTHIQFFNTWRSDLTIRSKFPESEYVIVFRCTLLLGALSSSSYSFTYGIKVFTGYFYFSWSSNSNAQVVRCT